MDKTLKMLIGGSFVRSESGRVTDAEGRLKSPLASRKDLRGAVEAAERASAGWSGATGYLRGQIVYRIAEMLEGRRASFEAMTSAGEVDAAVDALVSLAGWSDKYGQVFGSANQVAGPYHNFTVPGPVGVVGVVAPDEPSLLGLVGTIGPAVVCGCSVVCLVSRTNARAVEFGEVVETSDVPAGVVNLLTGDLGELAPHFASHRGISAVVACGVDGETRAELERGAAENMKRVSAFDVPGDAGGWSSPTQIERVLEFKTIWHPSSA